jgi:hypothetical protein
MINQSVKQQIDALNMLKHLSLELYEAAVQPDETMLPLVIEGSKNIVSTSRDKIINIFQVPQ